MEKLTVDMIYKSNKSKPLDKVEEQLLKDKKQEKKEEKIEK